MNHDAIMTDDWNKFIVTEYEWRKSTESNILIEWMEF